ncbi:MAG TPA: hypothetical protein VIL31_12775 [Cyclobacteriaceae bacterium]|jgi:hypothetical protein
MTTSKISSTLRSAFATVLAIVMLLIATSCEDVSDLAIEKVAAPVVVEVEEVAPNSLAATFFELDKSGILDHNIGIVQIPVPGLSVDVFAGGTKIGTFITDNSGKIEVEYLDTKPNEFAGTYKGTAFRIFK